MSTANANPAGNPVETDTAEQSEAVGKSAPVETENKHAPIESADNLFTKLPLELKHSLHKLRGVRLSIWVCYKLHENWQTGVAYLSLATVSRLTGHKDVDHLRRERVEMVKEGFLVPAGNHPARRGGSPVPCFRAVLPLTEERDHPPKKSGTEKVRDREIQVGTPRKSQAATPRKSHGRTRFCKQEKEENQTPHIPLRGGTVGWMVAEFANRTLGSLFYTDEEADAVESLVEQHGAKNIQDAFIAFIGRDGGFDGVKRPVSLFFQNLPGVAQKLRALREMGLTPEGWHP